MPLIAVYPRTAATVGLSCEGTLIMGDPGKPRTCRRQRPQEAGETIAERPGFTREDRCWKEKAEVGLLQIRKSSLLTSQPPEKRLSENRCSAALVSLKKREIVAWLWIRNGVEEMHKVASTRGWKSPTKTGTNPGIEPRKGIWQVPAPT
jgi:hypothetical protein